jgi:hypothetical protein
MKKERSVGRIIISRLIGLLVFIILLGIANIIAGLVNQNTFNDIINFLNSNFRLVLLFSILFLIGEIFNNLEFPFDLPAPIFNAFGAVLLTEFIFSLLAIPYLLNHVEVTLMLGRLYGIAIPAVFLAVIVFGYMSIFIDAVRVRKKLLEEVRGVVKDVEERKIPVKKKVIKRK